MAECKKSFKQQKSAEKISFWKKITPLNTKKKEPRKESIRDFSSVSFAKFD